MFTVIVTIVASASGLLLMYFAQSHGAGALGQASTFLVTITAIFASGWFLEEARYRRALDVWLRANKSLCAAILLVLVATGCFILGQKALGWLAVALAILFLLAYSCRWGNWCQLVGPWWRNVARLNLGRAWGRVWGFGRGPGADFAGWVWAWAKKGFRFTWNNLRAVLTVLTGAGLLYTALFDGQLWVSAWWWATAFILLVLPYKKLWKEVVVTHWKKLTTNQQGAIVLGGISGLGWCFYLTFKWWNDEPLFGFHIPLWGINGVGTVLGAVVFTLIVLSIMLRTSPKKPTPAQRRRASVRRAGAHP